MRTRQAVAGVGVALLLAAVPVMAHHAFSAEFDINKPFKLRGTLTKWEMINPHSWFHLDVKDESGAVVAWMIEGGSPNQLAAHLHDRAVVMSVHALDRHRLSRRLATDQRRHLCPVHRRIHRQRHWLLAGRGRHMVDKAKSAIAARLDRHGNALALCIGP